MRNYISVNAKYYTAKQVSKRAEHNNRAAKIDYLLPPENIIFQNIESSFGQSSMIEKFQLMNEKKKQIQNKNAVRK